MTDGRESGNSRRAWGPRRLVYTAHLWLGLTSGLIVFVVGLTGALYVFEPELKRLYAGPGRLSPSSAPALPASELARRAHTALMRSVDNLPAPVSRWLVLSAAPDRAVVYNAFWEHPPAWYEVYVDPYRGAVLAVHDQRWDLLNIVLRLHRSLLLPEELGRWIVGVAVLISVVMLLTGLVLWFPRRLHDLAEPGGLRQRLTIRFRGRFARVNYDLHRVFGFYGLALALIVALTGLVWSFRWMDRAVYWVATGGGRSVEPPAAKSKAPAPGAAAVDPADRVLTAVQREFPGAARYEVIFPSAADGTLQVCANPEANTYYRIECVWFDRYTGEPRRAERYADKNAGELMRALNYDIHVGQILGLPGRVLACAVSLVVASLPITGTLLWWRRGGGPVARRRSRRERRHRNESDHRETLMSAQSRILLLLCLVLVASRVSAQAPPPSPPPSAAQEPIALPELTVPGLLGGYEVHEATTATKTDIPLIETPATVNVIPRKQLNDQRLLTLPEALNWVPGFGDESSRGGFERFTLRGFFSSDSTFLDGLRNDPRFWVANEVFGLERIEILKGPASVLYGQVAPGGIVNLVSKRPLPEAHYELGYTAGSFSFQQGTVDIGGPVTSDKSVLYRVNGLYLNRDDFVDFVDKQRIYIAPAFTLRLGADTTLTLLANYINDDFTQPQGLPANGTFLSNRNGKISLDRFVGEPNFNHSTAWRIQGGYVFEHRFAENLRLHNVFRVQSFEFNHDDVLPDTLDGDQRTLTRFASGDRVRAMNVGGDTHLEWIVNTGPVKHRVLGGVDVFWDRFADRFYFTGNVAPIDVFNPVYGSPVPVLRSDYIFDSIFNSYQTGIYVQDQMTIYKDLTLLLGARGDFARNRTEDKIAHGSSYQSDSAATWRGGLLYQFVPGMSAYTSYATSFLPTTFGSKADGTPLKPEFGKQYEVGFKADLLDGRLTSSLALYQLTRKNNSTTDPVNVFFSVQTGEQRSRGLEWEGRVSPVRGWDLLAFYSLIDAEVTKDTDFQGNRLPGVPKNSAGLWTTWQFPSGPVQGLGFGFGGRYVGHQTINLGNTLELPHYTVLDASVFYRWKQLTAQVNFKNITDKAHYTGNSTMVLPGEPFSVLGQLTWNIK